MDEGILECLSELAGRCRFCAKNALVHLEKAERLIGVDSEMAIFRALTAEEEAATGVFYTVKQRNYPNAELLKPRDHVHKNALFPFLLAINNSLSDLTPPFPPTRLRIKDEGSKKRLTVELELKQDHWYESMPPLNFSMVGQSNQRRARFSAQLEKLADSSGKSVKDYLKDAANKRNQILYASDDGFPIVTVGVEEIVAFARWRVFILLRAMCLIYPYPQHALFVQQGLDAFLLAVGKVEEGDLEW